MSNQSSSQPYKESVINLEEKYKIANYLQRRIDDMDCGIERILYDSTKYTTTNIGRVNHLTYECMAIEGYKVEVEKEIKEEIQRVSIPKKEIDTLQKKYNIIMPCEPENPSNK